jgi:hypothetical protein
MDYWHVTLDGYDVPERESGDVITKDGEIIGTWSADAEDHCSFTPTGQTEPSIWNPFLGLFCKSVAAWYEEQEALRKVERPHGVDPDALS